ncbi:MAG: trigger factor [Oscillospiraceae bacterium]|nr:trigger factor [Oscillospiraceae bacterium]
MNAKAKAKKNLTRLIALFLAALMFIGMLASCTGTGTTATTATGFDYSSNLTSDGFVKDITASDYVTLPDYAAYEMPANLTVADQEAVDSEIYEILTAYATSEKDETVREVVEGDTVNMDYTGTIDGVAFEGGSTNGAGTDATIGAGTFIEGFEEQIVGHKPGETFDIFVTFPEDYHSEELAGKDATFSITLNYLCKNSTPELTEEFVAENLSDMYTSVADMVADIENRLVDTQMKNYVWSKLFDESEISEYPEAMMEYERLAQKDYLASMAAMYGLEAEDFIVMYGAESMDAYLAEMEPSFQETVKMQLVVQAIAEKEGVKVTDEDIKEYFKLYYGSEDYSSYETVYGKPYLKSMIMNEVVLDAIIEKLPVA